MQQCHIAVVMCAWLALTTTAFQMEKTWSYNLPYLWSVQNHAATANRLYVLAGLPNSALGNVTAIATDSGEVLWSTSLQAIGCGLNYYLDWVKLFADDTSVVVDCATNCASCGFAGLNPHSGAVTWFDTVSSSSEMFNGVLKNGTFYFPTKGASNTLKAKRSTTGVTLWSVTMDHWPEQTTFAEPGILIVQSPSVPMVALNASNGVRLWQRTYPWGSVWVLGSALLVQQAENTLEAVDAPSNKTMWKRDVGQVNGAYDTLEGTVLLMSSQNLTSVHVWTGAARFVIPPPPSSYFSAVTLVEDNTVLAVVSTGALLAYDGTSGRLLFTVSSYCPQEGHSRLRAAFAVWQAGVIFTTLPSTTSLYEYTATALNATNGMALPGPTVAITGTGTPQVLLFNHGIAVYMWQNLTAVFGNMTG